MQNVHRWQETNEPEKLYYGTKDNRDGSRGNKEGTARKSKKSLRRKIRIKARIFGYRKGWRTEAEHSIHNRRRNGNSSTKN